MQPMNRLRIKRMNKKKNNAYSKIQLKITEALQVTLISNTSCSVW